LVGFRRQEDKETSMAYHEYNNATLLCDSLVSQICQFYFYAYSHCWH